MIRLIKLYVQIQLHYVHKLHNIVLLSDVMYTRANYISIVLLRGVVYARASNVGVIIFENYVEFFSKFSIIINIRERVKINDTTSYTSRCSNKEAYYGYKNKLTCSVNR